MSHMIFATRLKRIARIVACSKDGPVTVIPWPRGFRWVVWRFVCASSVAALAGYVSWDHISGLLSSIGESPTVCLLAPLAVDGLTLIGVGGLMIPTQPRPMTPGVPVGVAGRAMPAAPVTPAGVPMPNGVVYGSRR